MQELSFGFVPVETDVTGLYAVSVVAVASIAAVHVALMRMHVLRARSLKEIMEGAANPPNCSEIRMSVHDHLNINMIMALANCSLTAVLTATAFAAPQYWLFLGVTPELTAFFLFLLLLKAFPHRLRHA